MKWNIARHLFQMGCRVTILPGTATADEVLGPGAGRRVFFLTVPGDPEPIDLRPADTIRTLIGKKPRCSESAWATSCCALAAWGPRPTSSSSATGGPTSRCMNLAKSRGGWRSPAQNHGFAVRGATRLPDDLGGDAREPQRRHDRGGSSQEAPRVQRSISPRGLGRPPR